MYKRNASFSDLFHNFPDLLFILDVNGDILAVNDTVTRRLGYAREELIGNSVLMVHPAERRAEAAQIVQRMIRDQEGHCPIPVLSKGGKLIPVETRVVPGRWGNRDVLFGVCRDISAVKLSEEKFSKTFHATAAVMALSTFDEGRFIDVNNAFLEVLGFSREEVIGKTAAELNIFNLPMNRGGALGDLVKQGNLRNYEARIQNKQGNLIYGLFSAETIYIQDALCLLTTMIDITERNKIEEARRENEENFRTFFETVDDMIVVGTPGGRIMYANTAVSRKLGYTLPELSAMHLLDLHPAEKRQEADAIFTAMFRGERESCPLPLASKNGKLVPVETRVWFGKWNGENCVFGISKDLTAEQEAQQRFERLFRNNPAPMAISVLSHTEFTDVNDSFLNTLGYTREEVIGQACADIGLFVHPDRHEAAGEKILREGRIASVELQVRRKDGEILDGLFSGELISSQGRQHFLTVMVDITDRKRAEEAVARISDFRQRVFNSSDAHLAVVDGEGRILEVNDAWRLFARENGGGDKQAWETGASYFRECTQDAGDASTAREAYEGIRQVQQNRLPNFEIEYPCHAPNGRQWFVMRVVPLLGSPGTVLVSHTNITARKQAEEAQKESQQKYYQLFNLESDALFLVDRETYQILDVNKAAVELYGYDREEFLEMRNLDLSAEPEKTHDAIKEGVSDVPTRWHRKKDGTVFPVEITGTYFLLGGKRVHLAAVRDNTGRMRIEHALRDSEERWKFALEGSGDGVWDWDVTTNHVHYSKQWKTMLGYSEQEIGATLDEWERRIHPDDKTAAYADIERHFRGETEIYHNEHRMLCKDGSYKWILDRGKVIEWTEDGKPRRVIGTHTDITDRKRTEEELAGHRNRLEELVKERTEELEGKTQVLQELNTALKVLLQQRDGDRKEVEERYVSNIKSLILPYAEKLKNTRLDERQMSYLGIMETHFDEIISPLLKSLQQFNLTPTEAQVASLIKDGKSTKEIASIMMVATGTIDNHRKSIRRKLGLNKIRANLQIRLKSIDK
jgi:PAS domain S-box-containing protein